MCFFVRERGVNIDTVGMSVGCLWPESVFSSSSEVPHDEVFEAAKSVVH